MVIRIQGKGRTNRRREMGGWRQRSPLPPYGEVLILHASSSSDCAGTLAYAEDCPNAARSPFSTGLFLRRDWIDKAVLALAARGPPWLTGRSAVTGDSAGRVRLRIM